MARRVELSPRPLRELGSITRWFQQPGARPRAARRLASIEASIPALTSTPCSYAAGAHNGTREMVCERHRVIFEVSPDTGDNQSAGDVPVLRIFGPGQFVT